MALALAGLVLAGSEAGELSHLFGLERLSRRLYGTFDLCEICCSPLANHRFIATGFACGKTLSKADELRYVEAELLNGG